MFILFDPVIPLLKINPNETKYRYKFLCKKVLIKAIFKIEKKEYIRLALRALINKP